MINNFDFIEFDEATHTYRHRVSGTKLVSVTKVIESLHEPFNKDYWLPKKAAEQGISEEELEAVWNEKKQRAANYGTRFHRYMEDKLNLVNTKEKFVAADKYLQDYNEDVAVATEVRVGNHLVAGTFDCVVKRNGRYVLKDWKTNGVDKFTVESKYNKKLLAPFNYLPDCKLTLYTLQLSMYRYLLDLPIWKMELVHFTEEDYKVYEVPYMQSEVWKIMESLDRKQTKKNDDSRTRISTEVFSKPIR